MTPITRQRAKEQLRGASMQAKLSQRPCEILACPRFRRSIISRYCANHEKQVHRYGSAYHAIPLEKTAEYRATHKALWTLINGSYTAIKPMYAEMRGLLSSLPTPPRQGSTRGLKPRDLAKAILSNIVKQRNHRSTRSRGITPARLILVAALAAECMPKPCSSPQYRRTQVARAIYKLLRTERRELFGRKFRVKISMQGKWTKQRLFELVEPIYRVWLQSNQEALQKRFMELSPTH